VEERVTSQSERFASGTKVRLKNDPSKIGVTTDRTRILSGRAYRVVRFSDGTESFTPEIFLETLDRTPDAVEDLRAGRLSDASDLARILTHIRLTGRLADLIYSMESTNTEFHAYQFKPVVKILNSPSRGLLIADEVGLGKTIEAGLVWTELSARYDVHRLLVVCPKSLQEKWRVELRDKFRIPAQAVDAKDLLAALRESEKRNSDFALVATLSGLRAPRGWDAPDASSRNSRAELANYLSEQSGGEPLFDMVVFDEAHHLRNPETAQHRTARQIVDLADYKLMLSATPINLRSEDLRSLLRLLEPDLFEKEWIFSQLQRENEPIVAAREVVLSSKSRLSEIAEALSRVQEGDLLKTERRLEILKQQITEDGATDTPARRADIAARLEEMSMLGGIVNRTRRRDVSEFQVKRRAVCRTWSMNPIEQEFYEQASAAIRAFAVSSDINDRFLLSNTQRMLASSLPAAFKRWANTARDLGLEGDEDDHPKAGDAPGPLISALAQTCRNLDIYDLLRSSDSKYALLKSAIDDTWNSFPDEKIIVFSSYRGTLDYLEERLGESGVATVKMHGSSRQNRDQLLREFAGSKGRCVLLTSEVGGEGLDLQFCRILFNFDLPWNPMRVEQRIGRIDRIGQRSPSVEIASLICEGSIEERIYQRLYQRLQIIEQSLGGFEAILGERVRELEGRLLDPTLSQDEVYAEIERAAQAAEIRKKQDESLEKEASGLIAHGEMILQRINRTHEQQRWIQARELHDYVSFGLKGAFPRSSVDRAPVEYEAFDVRLCPEASHAFNQYLEARARRSDTRLRRGDTVRVVFGKKPEGQIDHRIEVIAPTHPLVRFIAKLREDASEGMGARPAVYGRLRIKGSSLKLSPGRYGVAVQRWSFDGITPQDRLIYAGIHLETRDPLSDEQAESLLTLALDKLEPASPSAGELETAATTIKNVLIGDQMARAELDFLNLEAAIHEDKRATVLAVLNHQLDSHRDRTEARIAELLASGGSRARIVPAERGKLDKYVSRMDHKIQQAEKAGNFEFKEPTTYAVMVVEVER
jgi:superfamily II DNA or RNA helicase